MPWAWCFDNRAVPSSPGPGRPKRDRRKQAAQRKRAKAARR